MGTGRGYEDGDGGAEDGKRGREKEEGTWSGGERSAAGRLQGLSRLGLPRLGLPPSFGPPGPLAAGYSNPRCTEGYLQSRFTRETQSEYK